MLAIISEVSVTFVTFFITNTVQIFYKRVELETCHDAMWMYRSFNLTKKV